MKRYYLNYAGCLYYILAFTLIFMYGCPKKTRIVEKEVVEDRKVSPKEQEEKSKRVILPEKPEPPQQTTEEVGKEESIPEKEEPPVVVEEEERRLEDIHFEFNKYNLTPMARSILDKNAKFLLDNVSIYVQIEGHCDERGTEEYNLALGEKRALATKAYIEALGVSSERLKWISYGEEKPVDPRHNEEAWAKNRRAHFRIVRR